MHISAPFYQKSGNVHKENWFFSTFGMPKVKKDLTSLRAFLHLWPKAAQTAEGSRKSYDWHPKGFSPKKPLECQS